MNDIDHYRDFIPGCVHSETLHRTSDSYEASMDIRLIGRQETIITRNRTIPNLSLTMSLVSGPFKHLEGEWEFKGLGEGCRVTLMVDCVFSSSLVHLVSDAVLSRGIDKTIDAFVNRVREKTESSSGG